MKKNISISLFTVLVLIFSMFVGSQTVLADTNSKIIMWGSNIAGQTTMPSGISDVIAIDGGNQNTVALKKDGTVEQWGGYYNPWGYGIVDLGSRNSNIKEISTRDSHTVALKNDGTVIAWGLNYYKECTVPSIENDFVGIAAGDFFTVLLKKDGSMITLGQANCTVPKSPTNIIAIIAGARHIAALRNDGTVSQWGMSQPVPAGLKDVIAITAGASHTVALKKDGTVVAWGDNNYGQTNVPAGLKDVIAISGGARHTLALKKDGTVVAWGDNNYGQINLPEGLKHVKAIGAGAEFSAAIVDDLKLTEAKIASNNANPVMAKVGDTVTLAFKTNWAIEKPTVNIVGKSVAVTGSGTDWTATYVMSSDDNEGVVPFSITCDGLNVKVTTDNSTVTFDKTPPVIKTNLTNNLVCERLNKLTITNDATDILSGLVSIKTYFDDNEMSNPTILNLENVDFGSHKIKIIAIDKAGNVRTEVYSISITATTDTISKLLKRYYDTGDINNNGIYNSLETKLKQKDLKSFINEVNAQSGKHVTSNAAKGLLLYANWVNTHK